MRRSRRRAGARQERRHEGAGVGGEEGAVEKFSRSQLVRVEGLARHDVVGEEGAGLRRRRAGGRCGGRAGGGGGMDERNLEKRGMLLRRWRRASFWLRRHCGLPPSPRALSRVLLWEGEDEEGRTRRRQERGLLAAGGRKSLQAAEEEEQARPGRQDKTGARRWRRTRRGAAGSGGARLIALSFGRKTVKASPAVAVRRLRKS